MEIVQNIPEKTLYPRLSTVKSKISAKTRSLHGLKVSEEEYWEKYYDFAYEWNNGRLEEIPLTDLQNYTMFNWFQGILNRYLEVFPIAAVMGLEFGFRLELPDKTTIRKPDLTVICKNNPVILNPSEHSFRGIFDICIESLSDLKARDIKRDTMIKKDEYASAGVREYYLLDAKGDHTAFYRLNKRGGQYQEIKAKQGIIRSTVLPDFQFRLSDLKKQPLLQEMSDDPVYSKFVLPYYQNEKQFAELFKKQLYIEKQRADRLAAKLRALGISEE